MTICKTRNISEYRRRVPVAEICAARHSTEWSGTFIGSPQTFVHTARVRGSNLTDSHPLIVKIVLLRSALLLAWPYQPTEDSMSIYL